MNAAEKGALYARIFRKVGVFLGKGGDSTGAQRAGWGYENRRTQRR